MPSIHFYLTLALCTAAYKTTTAISTRGCRSYIDILKNKSVAGQLESYIRNEKDIIEIHVKTNTCIALTNDGNTISNTKFASASPIEKYNMFIYFIVTDTGRALMQYPADTDTITFGALASSKVMMDVDVMLDNQDCALNSEQFRTIFLQTLSTLSPITNNDDISVYYYEVSEKDWWLTVELLFMPYYTYNNFKTFCLTGGVVAQIPQALPNILLRCLCAILNLTLPIGFVFIPHTMYKKTDSYRKCDKPLSVSMFLSYITYWAPGCCINVNKSNKCRTRISDWFRENPFLRLFISIALVSFLFGFGIHYWLRNKNDLENDVLVLLGSSAFYHMHAIKKSIPCTFWLAVFIYVSSVCGGLIVVALLSVLIRYSCCCLKCFIPHSEVKTPNEISYPIYCLLFNCIDSAVKDLKYSVNYKKPKVECGNCEVCTDCKKCPPRAKVFCENCKLCLKCTKHCDTCKLCTDCKNRPPGPKVKCNECELCKHCKKRHISCKKILKCFLISFYHVVKLACTIVIVNITLIQTTTLILQWLVLTLFVGIPFYPNLMSNVILLTGLIKYTMQAFLKYQSKLKYVLDQMFKEDIYKNEDEIPKEMFNKVQKKCSSVNFHVVIMKIVALWFVWYTAFFAIKESPAGLSAWKDVIPSLILFITPDWLSIFIYNEAAENQYIDQCVKKAMRTLEIKNDETEEGWDCWPCCSTGGTEQTCTVDIELTSIVETEQTGTGGTEETSTEETVLKQIAG